LLVLRERTVLSGVLCLLRLTAGDSPDLMLEGDAAAATPPPREPPTLLLVLLAAAPFMLLLPPAEVAAVVSDVGRLPSPFLGLLDWVLSAPAGTFLLGGGPKVPLPLCRRL
jgi:hypothetical protein